MPDLAELSLPEGQSFIVDLDQLRPQLPEQLIPELFTDRGSWKSAAVLWSRTYNDYDLRQFFLQATERRQGFAIRCLDPVADALPGIRRRDLSVVT